MMSRALNVGALTFAVACAAAFPASAEWSRSFVVEWYEPALYFGADSEATNIPGTDCPEGSNPLPDWIELLKAGGMEPELAEQYADPEFRTAGNSLYEVMPIRGPGGVNIYEHPDAIEDPGLVTVQGDIAYGFDLDGDPSTGFAHSVNGETRGVDNAFYRATGCVLIFRGPPRGGLFSTYSNDGMRDGVYTVVFVLSGAGDDPMNDPDARLGVYIAQDKVVKDAQGEVSVGYSYRIDPDPRFQSVIDVSVIGGVVESRDRDTLKMRDFWSPGFFPKELILEDSHVRFEIDENGGMSGLIAGYRDWREHYRGVAGNGADGSGAIHENLGQFQLPGWWHALRRYADGMPDPETGEMRGISTVYSIDAVPGYVVTPDASAPVTEARLFEAPETERAAVER